MTIHSFNRLHHHQQPRDWAGFTIIEFIIASFVFSVILLLLTSGLIQLSRSYFKGVVSSNTQDTARDIVQAISQPLQFNGDNFVSPLAPNGPGDTVQGFCVGTKRFSYILANDPVNVTDTQSTVKNNILVEDDVSKLGLVRCLPSSTKAADITQPAPTGDPYTELMSPDMWLNRLQVCQVGTTSLFDVYVRVLYGPPSPSLFTPDIASNTAAAALQNCGTPSTQLYQCSGNVTGFLGSEFCAVSELDTVVTQRVVPTPN